MCWSQLFFFFFKQKTAYEMRISDWSSDVCSSDLQGQTPRQIDPLGRGGGEDGPLGLGRSTLARRHQPMVAQPRTARATSSGPTATEIGRAPCRERVCQYV